MSVLTKFAAKAVKETELFGKEVVSSLRKTQHVNQIGETKITSIFRGKKHLGSKIHYADGTTAVTSVKKSLGVTKSGDIAPAKVYKTETQMPDGTKVIDKNKLIKAGGNVEVKSSTTTKTTAVRRAKQQPKPVVEKSVAEQPVKKPVVEKPVKKSTGIKKLPPEAAKYWNWVSGAIMASLFAVTIGAFVKSLKGCRWTSSVPQTKENPAEDKGNDPFIFASCSSPKRKSTEVAKTKPQQKHKTKPQEKKQDLIEYTPKRGENWISILKAKYGVDDETAKAMAHKIKDMCYDDSLASKQSPVMYLPKVWKFNGKTYKYDDSTAAGRCKEFSDKVKTEMGKMSKDLKY